MFSGFLLNDIRHFGPSRTTMFASKCHQARSQIIPRDADFALVIEFSGMKPDYFDLRYAFLDVWTSRELEGGGSSFRRNPCKMFFFLEQFFVIKKNML